MPSALTIARHVLGADVIVVGMGPGVVGTGTRLGTTALEVAPTLDAVAWLGGEPIVCVRISDGDARERHRGVSHHTFTVLDAVRSRVHVATPDRLARCLRATRRHAGHDDRRRPTSVRSSTDHGLRVTTMGRDADRGTGRSSPPAGRPACWPLVWLHRPRLNRPP